jgi:hypothetical protein
MCADDTVRSKPGRGSQSRSFAGVERSRLHGHHERRQRARLQVGATRPIERPTHVGVRVHDVVAGRHVVEGRHHRHRRVAATPRWIHCPELALSTPSILRPRTTSGNSLSDPGIPATPVSRERLPGRGHLLTQRSHARDVHPYRSLNRLGRQNPRGACGPTAPPPRQDFLEPLSRDCPIHPDGSLMHPGGGSARLRLAPLVGFPVGGAGPVASDRCARPPSRRAAD